MVLINGYPRAYQHMPSNDASVLIVNTYYFSKDDPNI